MLLIGRSMGFVWPNHTNLSEVSGRFGTVLKLLKLSLWIRSRQYARGLLLANGRLR